MSTKVHRWPQIIKNRKTKLVHLKNLSTYPWGIYKEQQVDCGRWLGLTSPCSFPANCPFQNCPSAWGRHSVWHVNLPFNAGPAELLKFVIFGLWVTPVCSSQPCSNSTHSKCFPLTSLQDFNFRLVAKTNNHFYKANKNTNQQNSQEIGKAKKVWFSSPTNSAKIFEKENHKKKKNC